MSPTEIIPLREETRALGGEIQRPTSFPLPNSSYGSSKVGEIAVLRKFLCQARERKSKLSPKSSLSVRCRDSNQTWTVMIMYGFLCAFAWFTTSWCRSKTLSWENATNVSQYVHSIWNEISEVSNKLGFSFYSMKTKRIFSKSKTPRFNFQCVHIRHRFINDLLLEFAIFFENLGFAKITLSRCEERLCCIFLWYWWYICWEYDSCRRKL